jgi:hypothetical protein
MNAQHYNEVMPETDDRHLFMKIDKPITEEGYRMNFMARIEEMVARHGEVRMLLWYKNYEGWEKEAAKLDIETTVIHRDKLVKCAMVNPPQKEILQKKIKQVFMSGEIRFFAEEDLDEAAQWLRQP